MGVLGDYALGYLAQMLDVTNSKNIFDKRRSYFNQYSNVQVVVTLYGLSKFPRAAAIGGKDEKPLTLA